jgi:hypothetical protein
MQIRQKKNKAGILDGPFYLLRARWDGAKKRSVQDLLGSAGEYSRVLKLREGVTLTTEEQAQWEAFVADREKVSLGRREAMEASTFCGQVKAFHRLLLAHPELVSLEECQAQREAIHALSRDLKKHARKLREGAEKVVEQ